MGLFGRKSGQNNGLQQKQLLGALETAWEHIDPEYLKNLVESIPRRLEAVLKAKGGHTKYWKLKNKVKCNSNNETKNKCMIYFVHFEISP